MAKECDDFHDVDLGSIKRIGQDGCIRYYEGLSKDYDKLPHYVGTGSACLMLDTGEYYKYHEDTDVWYLI